MTVEKARLKLQIAQRLAQAWRHRPHVLSECDFCGAWALHAEARAITYDLAVSVRHQPTVDPVEAINRPRAVQETVAW